MSKHLSALLQGIEILETRGDLRALVSGLSYDSRQAKEGDLFVAVMGTRLNGSLFVEDAIRRGAVGVVAESAPQNGISAPFVRVADSRKALARLARNLYDDPSQGLDLIGITGTNGKTTTTLLIESIVKQAGHSAGVCGTLGYRWAGHEKTAARTTPESSDLQQLFHEMRRDGVKVVVMEVSSHALALGRVEGCAFRAGVFTNLSQDHLDFHHTMEDYFETKLMLFRDYLCAAEKCPVAVVNADDPYGRKLMERSAGETWSYSLSSPEARVWVKSADLSASGIRAELSTPSGALGIQSPLIGRLNLYNLVAAAATCLALGYSKEDISEGLRSVSVVDGRLQRVHIPPELGYEVVVDYAHTPDAMEKSLTCIREMTRGRLLVVFGCGGDRDRGKRPVMGRVGAQLGDLVILTSDNPRSEDPERIVRDIEPGVLELGLSFVEPRKALRPERGYTIEVDRKKAIELALSWARAGDVVFVGGKGHETYQVIGSRVIPFDDRMVVRECLGAAGHLHS